IRTTYRGERAQHRAVRGKIPPRRRGRPMLQGSREPRTPKNRFRLPIEGYSSMSSTTAIRHPLCVAALGAAAALAWSAATRAQPPGPPGEEFKVVTYVEGLKNPWSMAWLPNGDMLVTERGGALRIVRNGKLLPDAVAGTPKVRAQGQGGLFDVVLHP